SDYNLICRNIQPEQVISLTICDDNDTPGQSQLFFSHFRIEQFTRLHSLTLIRIELQSLRTIFSDLYKLKQLRSLSFDIETVQYKYPNDTHTLLINNYTQVIPQLNHLHLNNRDVLMSGPLPYLHSLKLEKCSVNELETIFQQTPQLKSLCVCLNMNSLKFKFNIPNNQLIRLNLKIHGYRISIEEIEQFLSQLHYLKHLELITKGWQNLFDGYRWQRITNTFIMFNFKFDAPNILMANTLESFSTPFWLEIKHWFVGYKGNYLFSIPHFAPDHLDISSQPLCIHLTALNHTIIYDGLNKITIREDDTIDKNHYFTHSKELELKCSISLKNLTSTIDLNQIKHLSILSLNDLLGLIPLESTMPQLHELSIKDDVTSDMIEIMKHYQFKQIHKLEISVFSEYNDYVIEELSRIFLYTQYLIYKSPIQSKQTMVRFIDGFKHLSNASFYGDSKFFITEYSFLLNPNSLIKYSQRLTKDNFTCRLYYLKTSHITCSIHWWIDEQVNHFLKIKLF
ncbi:unnamed protein product, partial [Didymodactylos carnosus]